MNLFKWTTQGDYRTVPAALSWPYMPPPRIERETPARHDVHPFNAPLVVVKTTDEPKEIYAAPVSYFCDEGYRKGGATTEH